MVVNSGAENYTFSGDNITHENNGSYSDNTVNPTDYYYLLINANDNSLNGIHVERIGNLYHKGHGIVLKSSARNNVIRNSNCINTAFELSFNGVENNLVEDCYVGNYDSNVGRGKIGSFLIANGAHDNTIRNCTVNLSSESAVKFMDWIDGSNNPGDAADAGNNNTIVGCSFSNAKYGIDFNSDWGYAYTPAHANVFDNCSFRDMEYFFRADRLNYDNVVRNCSVENMAQLKFEKSVGTYALQVGFENNTFANNGFSNPN